MNEALLQTIWKYKLVGQSQFIGTKNEAIEIISIGEHNQDSGPDFFNSKLSVDGIVLAGNVEIHIKTSDWLKHKHQQNKVYDNLILHVVYEHDVELQQNLQHNVSVLELKNYIKPSLLQQYQAIEFSKQPIACGKSITTVPEFEWAMWLERLAITRIEQKTETIYQVFENYQHHYEDTLFVSLCRNFGFKINNDAFELLGKSIPFTILKKYADNSTQLEALLFGVAGFLEDTFMDAYPKLLQNEFEFLKQKHQLVSLKKELWKFSKTRPANFPTIRLSQLAFIIHKQQSLYHLLETKTALPKLKEFFSAETSTYWQTHFKFDTLSDNSIKQLGNSAFQSIVINTIVPFLVFMGKQTTNDSYTEYALDLLTQLPAEENSKTNYYKELGIKTDNALQSQAQIHLYDNYCKPKSCLQCNVAKFLLKN